jgi:hypothetical protein
MNLSHIVFALFASLVFGHAYAETNWVIVGTAHDDSETYIDASRLKAENNLVRAWVLLNHPLPKPHPNGQTWMSMVMQDEIDCAGGVSRSLSTYLYSERDGKGRPIETSTEAEKTWSSSPPDSAGDKVRKFVCELTRKDGVPYETVLRCTLVYGALFMSSRNSENKDLLAYAQVRVQTVAPKIQSYRTNPAIQEKYKQIAKKNKRMIELLERDFRDAIATRDNNKLARTLNEVSACDRKLGVQGSRVPVL